MMNFDLKMKNAFVKGRFSLKDNGEQTMKTTNGHILRTQVLHVLGFCLFVSLPTTLHAQDMCTGLTEDQCTLSLSQKQPLEPVPSLFKFQARVAQAKLPLPNAEFQQVFVKVLQGASNVLCVEQFRNVQVRDSVLNLEIGRNMSCDLGPTIAQNSDLQFQVCLGSEGNCLRPISLGTTPYAIQSSYSEWSQNTAHADISTQAHYAHRITADRSLLVTGVSQPNVGYFDFYTDNDDSKYEVLQAYMGDQWAGANRHGFMQWTPSTTEGNALHLVSRSNDGSETIQPLDRFYVYGLESVFSKDARVKEKLTVERNALVGTTLFVGHSLTIPGDGNPTVGTGSISAEGITLTGPNQTGYLRVDARGVAGAGDETALVYHNGQLRVYGNGAGIASGQGDSDDAMGTNDTVGLVKADSLWAEGDTRVDRDVNIGRHIDIGGNQTIEGTITAQGSISTEQDLDVDEDATVNGRLEVKHIGGEADSYIQRLRVHDLIIDGDFDQTPSNGSMSTSANLSVDDFLYVGGNVAVGDNTGGGNTTLFMNGLTGDLTTDGEIVAGGTSIFNNLQVNGTFTMPGSMGMDQGIRANNVVIGMDPDYTNFTGEDQLVASRTGALTVMGNNQLYLRTKDRARVKYTDSQTTSYGQYRWFYPADNTDGTGNSTAGGMTGQTEMLYINGELRVNGNLNNTNCSGCFAPAGGDPRSHHDVVGRVIADAFYAHGDSYVARNLEVDGSLDVPTISSSGQIRSNTMRADEGVRAKHVSIGQNPDYVSLSAPYESISTTKSNHNLRLSTNLGIYFQNRNSVNAYFGTDGIGVFNKGIRITGTNNFTHSWNGRFGAMTWDNVAANVGLPGWPWGPIPASLYVAGNIVGNAIYIVSDERTKSIIGVSDAEKDLDILKQIEVTDFTYIDVIQKGGGEQKKVIAQQVQKVFPQAVSQSTDSIPDIYKAADAVEYEADSQELIVELIDHGLDVGERVKLIHKNGEFEVDVIEVPNADQFVVGEWTEPTDWVFVYGREVNDFLTVDYEAISMLNVSATQALAEKVDGHSSELELLKAENENLKTRLAKMEKILNNLDLSKMANKAVVKPKVRPWYHVFMWWL